MTIAYVLNTYPQPSHSFIRRELRALEAAGRPVLRLAMRRPTMPLVDPMDHEEEARTTYILEAGAAALAGAVLHQAVRAPRKWGRALRAALAAGRRSPLGRLRHLIYFSEACHVARHCAANDVRHIHAHFGTNPAMVAMLTHLMGGPSYSFTVHGPEEFDAPAALSLDAKIAHSAFTVGVSQYGRSQLCRWAAPDDWPRLKVVHCGIEPQAFPDPAPVPEGLPRLVTIGRFSEQKGQLVAIEAMARVCRDHPEAQLVLIGEGEMRGAIEAGITRLGLQDNIRLTGWLSEADLRAELARAQALVLPSFAEGLPMVIMEAMAAGRPVIATYVAGIPELVQDGRTGWLVPAGDTQALADAIGHLAGHSAETLTRMGAEARARVLQRHDAMHEAMKLAGHLDEMAGRGT